jgi:hypothetical protein
MLLMLALQLLLHHADVCAGQPAAGLRRLSVEYRQRPQDIGVGVPTFSWEIVDHARGITQSGFTLTVTTGLLTSQGVSAWGPTGPLRNLSRTPWILSR